jgi:uncharacterized membrane protein YdjX (TVP38/TMEM64 family)
MALPMERTSLSNQPSFVFLFRRVDFWLAIAALIAAGLLFWRYETQILHMIERAPQSRAWIEGYGPLAPLAYITLYATQIVVAPLPGNLMGILAGYLFGILWGALYSVVALTLGISVVVGLSRFFGRPLLERFVADDLLEKWESKLRIRSPLLWIILFMFPVPDALIYVAGLSSMPLRILIPSIVTGRSTGIIFATAMGGWSARLPSHWLIVNWTLFLAGAALLYLHQRRLKLYTLLAYRQCCQVMRRRRSTGGWRTNRPAVDSGHAKTALFPADTRKRQRLSTSEADESA